MRSKKRGDGWSRGAKKLHKYLHQDESGSGLEVSRMC